MYPCLDVIAGLTSLPTAYLEIVVPIISASALSQCGCTIETDTLHLIESIDDKDVVIDGEIAENYVSEYFLIYNKKYCCKTQVSEDGKTTLTMDETIVTNGLIGGSIILLNIPSGLTLAISNEVMRNSVNGIDSESSGNTSVKYSQKSSAEFSREIGNVVGCYSGKKGAVFV